MPRRRILAVDDNAVNLAALEQALQEEYEVVPMISGRRAIKYLMCERVDMVLLDVQMPSMDGFETLAEIRKTEYGVTVPVIFLTAMKDRNTVIEGSKLGIMDYITKPFDTNDLKARIEHVFNRVQGAPIEKGKFLDCVKNIITILETGNTKQGISKIQFLLGFQLEDEIFKRLKNAMETLENGKLESGINKVKRVLQMLQIASNDSQVAIGDRELYVKLLCAKAYVENCKSKDAIEECQDLLQCALQPELKERIQEVQNKLLSYDDDDAKIILKQLIDELGNVVV